MVRKGKRSLLASHARCKCSMETTHNSAKVKLGIKVMKLVESLIGREVTVGQGSRVRMSSNICERVTPYCSIRSPYRPLNFPSDDFKRSTRYPCLSSLLESRLALRIKHSRSKNILTPFHHLVPIWIESVLQHLYIFCHKFHKDQLLKLIFCSYQLNQNLSLQYFQFLFL